MANEFIIKKGFHSKADSQVTGSINISATASAGYIKGTVVSGSYVGDGSNLTGVSAFPFTGDARITGSLTTSGSVVDFTKATAISGSIFSGSTYYGDGSNLTGISSTPFPFNGDAVITGSLTVSQSFVDFSNITDIKTRKFAITSQILDPGIKVTSASFYDSFIESLDAAVDGDTIHVFANDSASAVADSFSNKNITILGNGHTFTTDGWFNVHQRFSLTSCSLDIYDYTFFRNNVGHSSYPAASMWQIDKTTLNLYNTEFSASSGYALGINKDCIINGGKFISDKAAIYGQNTPNDNTEIRNVQIESDYDGIVLVGDSIKVLNCDVLYHQDSATSQQTKAIVLTGNSCLIQNCNIEGDKEAKYGSAVAIGTNTGASLSVRNEIQNLSINLGEIYAYGYTDIQGCNVFGEGNQGIYFLGTGSISDCAIEVPGSSNYGYGIYLPGMENVRVSNVYSKGNIAGVHFTGKKQFFNCVFDVTQTNSSHAAFCGEDVTDLEADNIVGTTVGGPYAIKILASGSGKLNLNNITSTIYNVSAISGYDLSFVIQGSENTTLTLRNSQTLFHSEEGDSGTSPAMQLTQLTSSYIDNVYSEGYKYGVYIDAISSSINNSHFVLKTDAAYHSNRCATEILGNENTFTNTIFEIDKAHQDSDPVVMIMSGDHNFKNSTFRASKATGQYLISGSSATSASLINNKYEIADYAYITASNVTDITTGYIDGRGNWHRDQVTSSFDYLSANTFSGSTYYGDGSNLTGIAAGTNLTQSLFVSPSGNDATAVVGDLHSPFQTILGATGSANPGDTIFVYPGTYIENNNLYKDAINYHFYDGAIVKATSPVEPMWGGGTGQSNLVGTKFSSSISITGHGEFISEDSTAQLSAIFYLSVPSGVIEFKRAFKKGLGASYSTAANFCRWSDPDSTGVLTIRGATIENSGSVSAWCSAVAFSGTGKIVADNLIVRQHGGAGNAVMVWAATTDLRANMDVYSEGVCFYTSQRTDRGTELNGRYETLSTNQDTYYAIYFSAGYRGYCTIDAEVLGAIYINPSNSYEAGVDIRGYQYISNSPGGGAVVITSGDNLLSQHIYGYGGPALFKITGGQTSFNGYARMTGNGAKLIDISGGKFFWRGSSPGSPGPYPSLYPRSSEVSGGELVIESQLDYSYQNSYLAADRHMFNLSGGTLEINSKVRMFEPTDNNGIVNMTGGYLKMNAAQLVHATKTGSFSQAVYLNDAEHSGSILNNCFTNLTPFQSGSFVNEVAGGGTLFESDKLY